MLLGNIFILLGNILDHEMENLYESNPISFIIFMSLYKIIEACLFYFLWESKKFMNYSYFPQKTKTKTVENFQQAYLVSMIKISSYITTTMVPNLFCSIKREILFFGNVVHELKYSINK